MITSSLLFGVLSVMAVGPVSGQSFELQAAREIKNLSAATERFRSERAPFLPWSRAAAAPSKGFDSVFKCENETPLAIELKSDGTVTVNGDNLVPDGADHPYKGIQYNCSFTDAETFRIRIFGKMGSLDIDALLTLTLVDGGRTLRVSKNDKTSSGGRRVETDETFACSRAFFGRW